MKQEIKTENKVFEFDNPISIGEWMVNWCNIVEQQNNNNDVWTVIPELPEYKFKNLRIENSPFETNEEITELTIKFIYDDIEYCTKSDDETQ